MSERAVKQCPECGGWMEEGERLTYIGDLGIPHAVKLAKKDDVYGGKIIPFYCKRCGYTKLYKGQ